MLTGIKIKNAYSIKETEISFLKGKFGYKKEMVEDVVVSPVAFYGSNGSGKTSLVNVLNDLVNLLILDRESFYPIIANFNSKSESTLVELSFKLGEDLYSYSLTSSFSNSLIENESLIVNSKAVFTRNQERIIVEDKEYAINDSLMLALRVLYGKQEELNDAKDFIKKAYNYLTNISVIKGEGNICNSKLCNYKNIESLMMENSDEVKRVIASFKDFPLFDFYSENESEYLNVYLNMDGKVKLPGFLISDGMLTMLKILTLMVNLEEESVLVIDSIEKNLHHSAIMHLISEARKRKIQLIFTSHNTSLMQDLRPDQIYFARFKQGFSYYFRLSNIYENIREINNIEKMYLSNTFNDAINEIISVDE